jgi:Leucine Rich repeat
MPQEPKPASRSRRRLLRVSVRGLIVLVLLLGGSMGWIVRSARVQRDAVAAIRNAGGCVLYDWQWNNGRVINEKPWAAKHLVDAIGVDYFGHVTGVAISSPKPATDATLAHVGRLSRLEILGLSRSSVDDDGLAQLKGLNELVYLDLGDTQVSNFGIAHLAGLMKLRALNLAGTRVTDAGIKELKRTLPGVFIRR